MTQPPISEVDASRDTLYSMNEQEDFVSDLINHQNDMVETQITAMID